MKKILLSSVIVVAAAAVVVGATTAFFSDTETSTGNTFTAGSIDLKVDSDCHYWNLVSYDAQGVPQYEDVGCGDINEQTGVGVGQWEEDDLGRIHQFFNFSDIKPGDKGEDTISLHVYDNDAWGRILMSLTGDDDNDCTEPEGDEEDEDTETGCDSDGELLEAMLPGFSMCLDQGLIPGFQNINSAGVPVNPVPDPTEGDNICQNYEGETWNLGAEKELSEVLSNAYNTAKEAEGDPDFDLLRCREDGHNNYDRCNGLAADGRMVGSTTYYFALNWKLPLETGNEVQTDSLSGNLSFEVEQHRNNPNPF